MRMPSNTFPPQDPRQSTAPGCSRRTFLLVGGATVALAGGGWWLHARQSSQPPVVPVDTHRVLNLPVSGDHTPSYRYLPALEYAWLPDSMHLAIALPNTLFVVNVRTSKTVWQQARSLEKEQDAVLLLNWSADGKQIQVIQESGVPGGQIGWSGPSQVYNPQENPWEFAFSADRSYMAFVRNSEDDAVEIWNLPQKSLVARYQDPQDTLDSPLHDAALAWSPTGPSLAIYTNWKQPEIHLWQMEKKRVLWTTEISTLKSQPASEGERGMKWSSDGQFLAYAYDSAPSFLGVLDARTGALRFQMTMAPSFPGAIEESFAWSPDGTRLAFFATEGNTPVLQVWQAQAGRHLFTCQRVHGSVGLILGGVGSPDTGEAGIISWSPDGKYLVARAHPDSQSTDILQFWDAQTGKALFSYQAPGVSGQLLWSPDSHFLTLFAITSTHCTSPSFGMPSHISCAYTYALQVFRVE